MTVTRPPFDPELLAALQKVPRPDVDAADVVALRRQQDAVTPSIDSIIARTGFEHRTVTAPGPYGAPDITLDVVRDPRASGPGPIVYHTHGGGMMFGTSGVGAAMFPSYVEQLGATVVSVTYRLAPEHPYPAGVEDVYAGLLWTTANAAAVGGDPSRILITGASAGGGLTAAVALMARDRHGPRPIGQLLTCPMLDDRVNTGSARQFMRTPALWSGEEDVVGWTALLGTARATEGVSPYAAPARATDLSRLPPAYVEVGSAEVFRDEDVDYATRIWAAGGQAELHVWPGAYHGYEMIGPNASITTESRAARLSWARRLLTSGSR